MIDLGRPALQAEGVTVLADHADETLFHLLPVAPRIALRADGSPDVSLVAYRVDEQAQQVVGAGLLTLTVDLGVDEARLTRLRSRLAARTGRSRITLAPVAAEAGRADLVLLGTATAVGPPPVPAGAPHFVVRPVPVGAPLLTGDKATTFVAVLSPEGVTLVEAAIATGGLPAAVLYSLTTTGLRPALRARVTARWREVYHFFENRLHGGKLLLATDIGPTLEELRHEEALTVEVDELVPAAERPDADRRAVEEVQRHVLQELFTPTLGQAPPAPDAEADGLAVIGTAVKDVLGAFSLTYSLREIDRDELKTLTYDFSSARAEPLVLGPQGSLAHALEGLPTDGVVTSLEPTAPPQLTFDVGAARDLAGEDVEHLEVALVYGDQRRDLLLDPASPRTTATLWYEPALGPEVELSWTAHFVPASGDVDRLTAPPRRTADRVVRVDPRELCRRVVTRVVAQGVPFERYPRVLVDLRRTLPDVAWSAERTVELDAATREATDAVRVVAGRPVLLQRRVRYVGAQGQVTTLDWEPVEEGVLVVGDPEPDVADVQLLGSARFGTQVARLVVELRPRSDPGRVDVRVLTADAPVAGWSWAAGAAGERGYDYRVTVHTVRGEVREGAWEAGPPGKLVVGEGIRALRAVTLYLVGATLAQLGLLAVKVRLSAGEPGTDLWTEDERLLTDLAAPVSWSYPLGPGGDTSYAYQLTAVHADGRQVVEPPVVTTDLLAVVPVPAGA